MSKPPLCAATAHLVDLAASCTIHRLDLPDCPPPRRTSPIREVAAESAMWSCTIRQLDLPNRPPPRRTTPIREVVRQPHLPNP